MKYEYKIKSGMGGYFTIKILEVINKKMIKVQVMNCGYEKIIFTVTRAELIKI